MQPKLWPAAFLSRVAAIMSVLIDLMSLHTLVVQKTCRDCLRRCSYELPSRTCTILPRQPFILIQSPSLLCFDNTVRLPLQFALSILRSFASSSFFTATTTATATLLPAKATATICHCCRGTAAATVVSAAATMYDIDDVSVLLGKLYDDECNRNNLFFVPAKTIVFNHLRLAQPTTAGAGTATTSHPQHAVGLLLCLMRFSLQDDQSPGDIRIATCGFRFRCFDPVSASCLLLLALPS